MSQDLSDEQGRRWEVFKDAANDLAGAVKDGGEVSGALAAASQAAGGLDHTAFLNATHLPSDAGEHAEGLARILARIPDGWGRWISCGPGWYPIICRLDQEIAALSPGYHVQQVKEKFGGLRFYYGLPPVFPPGDPEPVPPADRKGPEMESYQEARRAWRERGGAYFETDEGRAASEAATLIFDQVRELVQRAEGQADKTCEVCSSAGTRFRTRRRSPWLKTLCPSCAASNERDFISSEEWEAWWAEEAPRVLAHDRQRFRAQHSARRCLVASDDPSLRVNARRVRYVSDPSEAARILRGEDFDDLWLDDSPTGRAAVAALSERFADHDPRGETTSLGTNLHPPAHAPRLWPVDDVDVSALREKVLKLGWTARSIWGE